MLKFKLFTNLIDEDLPKVARMKQRLAEKDPEKRTYGENMSLKVQSLVEEYDNMYEIYEESMKPRFEHLVLLEKQKEMRRQQQEQADEESEFQARVKRAREETEHEEKERQQLLKFNTEEAEAEAKKLKEAAQKQQEEEEAKHDALLKSIALAISNELSMIDSSSSTVASVVKRSLSKLTSLSMIEFRQICDDLSLLIQKIAGSPDVSMFRFIRVSNENFQRTLGKKSGAFLLLRAIGFQLYNFSQIKHILIKIYGSLSNIPDRAKREVFLYLPEPLVGEFEKWIEWRARLDAIQLTLARVVESCGKLDAHEAGRSAAIQWSENEIDRICREGGIEGLGLLEQQILEIETENEEIDLSD